MINDFTDSINNKKTTKTHLRTGRICLLMVSEGKVWQHSSYHDAEAGQDDFKRRFLCACSFCIFFELLLYTALLFLRKLEELLPEACFLILFPLQCQISNVIFVKSPIQCPALLLLFVSSLRAPLTANKVTANSSSVYCSLFCIVSSAI